MKIPEPVQKLFDRFPLVTFPSTPSFCDKDAKSYSFVIKLQPPSEVSSSDAFILAVHNVKSIEAGGSTKVIPTDPIGLQNALILCHKNGLCLPSDSVEQHSPHTIMPMSYLASPNNELPMMLETTNNKTEAVVLNSDLKKSLSSKFFVDPAERLLNDLLDGFYDVWIFAMIYDLPLTDPKAIQNFYYQDSELGDFGSIIATKVLNDMTKWGTFRQRYSHLFNDNSSYVTNAKEFFVGYNSGTKGFEQAYFSKLVEFDFSIPVFLEYFKVSDTSETKSILQLKFASFFICINFFIPKETHLSRTALLRHTDAIEFSMRLLNTY